MLTNFNYQDVERALNQHFGQIYDEFTIIGASLDDIESSTANSYDVERHDDDLFIFSDNVLALLEEDSEDNIIEGSVRKSLRAQLSGRKSTYRDRKILDLPKRF